MSYQGKVGTYDPLFYVTSVCYNTKHDTIFFVQSSAVRGLRL